MSKPKTVEDVFYLEDIQDKPLYKKIIFSGFVHSNLILCNVIWGTMQVTNKWALSNYFDDPITFSTIRFFISIPFLLLVAMISLRWNIKILIPKKLKHFFMMILLGILLGSQQALYITGLSLTSASNTAVLGCLSPAFGLVFSLILRREKFYFFKLLGTIFAVIGTLIIVDVVNMEFTGASVGDLLVICSSLIVSINLMTQDVLIKQTGNSQLVIFWGVSWAAVFLLLVSLFNIESYKTVPDAPFEAWIPILYAAIFATAFCYGMNGWCMKYVTPIVAISYLTVQPIAATVLEITLGGTVTLHFIFGSIFVISGIFFVILGRYQESKNAAVTKKSETLALKTFSSSTL